MALRQAQSERCAYRAYAKVFQQGKVPKTVHLYGEVL